MSFAVVFAAVLLASGTTQGSSPPLPDSELTLAQKKAILERAMQRVPFLSSPSVRDERETVGKFFQRADYNVLSGNPLLGYWDVGGFQWRGARVAWGGVAASDPSCRPIQERAWKATFDRVVTSMGMTVSPEAPVRFEAGCVAAAVDASNQSPVPGVMLEARIWSPSGTLRYRMAVGRPTIADAMGATLDFILRFARRASAAR